MKVTQRFLLRFVFITSMLFVTFANADITGKIFKDFDMNGIFNGGDAPVIGVMVKATCTDGQSYVANTDTNGLYTLSGFPIGSKCRIEVNAESVGFGSGINALGGAPLVAIVSDGQTHNVTVGSPATYCQANPDVIMAALPGYYTEGTYWAGGGQAPLDLGTVFKVPAPTNGTFNSNATIATQRTTLAKNQDTGAIWGAAWKKGTKELFVAAALKRYVPLKDESSATNVQSSAGTIYELDTTTTPATISIFTIVPNVLSSTATTELSNRDYGLNQDLDVMKYAGRMGLGDLEISEDETKLYTVNMHTKELIIIDSSTGNILQSVAIPNPYTNSECANDMVRPWALKVKGSDVFIGSVCEDQVENNVGASVQKYNGAIFQTIAQTNSLRYLRARGYGPNNKALGDGYRYRNWTSNSSDAPMLTDIEFTNNGNLVLGYNSRATYNRSGSLRGDIRKMCLNANGTYTDESTDIAITSCATHIINHDGNPTDYHEFYFGDYFGSNYGGYGHPETASGALAQAPGAANIIVGMIDATDWYQPGAIGNYDNTTGDKVGAQAVIDKNTIANGGEREAYGSKAGGMGDVELLCDSAPIEVGNLVWIDGNQDGIQDPNEPGIPNVPVTLVCNGNTYGTATTDADGHYYFGGLTNINLNPTYSLNAGLNCELRLAKADVNNKPPTVTNPNSDNNDTIDNDAVDQGANNVISFTLGVSNDHSLDFGITPTIGCVTGTLFQDNNTNTVLDGPDTLAPAGITVTAVDSFGGVQTAVTDASGVYTFNAVPAGAVTISVDVTDTDIPQGAVWSTSSSNVPVTEGTPPTCTIGDFPYTLPAPIDQDPKDVATCANPTSITWDGATVSSATVWQNMLGNPLTETTSGGTTVNVTMSITDNDGEFYDTDLVNTSGSGTSAAFGQPYLTLYLGDQSNPGNGMYNNPVDCAVNGYDLEAGESTDLEVVFDQEVVLDNWRIRDVDSGDIRNSPNPNTPDWQWQDGIKVEGFDAAGNSVVIEAKIGTSGAGLIVDTNNIVHTDANNYDAGGGDFATGAGTTPNATNGHIVLTSNFVPIKKIIVTHVAGPDIPCQTRSALAMAGLSVCVPLKISGTLYDDNDGVKSPVSCNSSDNKVDGIGFNNPDGVTLNACLLNQSNNIVIDTMVLNSDGTYDFDTYIEPNKSYKVMITKETCTIGSSAPSASLPQKWVYEGEVIDPTNNTGHDGIIDGTIDVNVGTSNVSDVDFAINKTPEAVNYARPSEANPGGNGQAQYTGATGTYTIDLEENDDTDIELTSISGGLLYYAGAQQSIGDILSTTVDFTDFSVDPIDGDVITTFSYKAMDKACRKSDIATFTAPFVGLGSWGGRVAEDTNNDDAGDIPLENVSIELYSDPNCDGDENDGTLVSTEQTDVDGYYNFTGLVPGCYIAVEIQPSGYLDVAEDEGGVDDDQQGVTPINKISGQVDAGETDTNNDFVEERPGSWNGNVSKDTNNDGVGDEPIVGVIIRLFTDPNGDGNPSDGLLIATTTTNTNGDYSFDNLSSGHYVAIETQPFGLQNVSENEGGVDNDKANNTILNAISGVVDAGENDNRNDFVEAPYYGAITGNVGEDTNGDGISDKPIQNVEIVLFDENGKEVERKRTDANGNYIFIVPPGEYYVQERQPNGLYDVHENEGGLDNDLEHALLNTIGVIVNAGETDVNNDFVESKTPVKLICGCPPTPCPHCGTLHATNYASEVKDHEVILNWQDYYDEALYEIYVNGKFIAIVQKDTVTYKLSGLSSNSEYTVRIVAKNALGQESVQTFKFKTTNTFTWLPAIYNILLN